MIGHRGNTIAEILQTTGVSVEMPPNDSTTGTITLRGPHDKLGLGGYLCILRNKVNLMPNENCINVSIQGQDLDKR